MATLIVPADKPGYPILDKLKLAMHNRAVKDKFYFRFDHRNSTLSISPAPSKNSLVCLALSHSSKLAGLGSGGGVWIDWNVGRDVESDDKGQGEWMRVRGVGRGCCCRRGSGQSRSMVRSGGRRDDRSWEWCWIRAGTGRSWRQKRGRKGRVEAGGIEWEEEEEDEEEEEQNMEP